MKGTLSVWLCLFSAVAISAGALVPIEFQGTWASSPRACKRPGDSTLTITDTNVLAKNLTGSINVGWTSGRKSLEVVFSPYGGGPHKPGVRTFTLSSAGETLYEINGSEVVASRTKCKGPMK